MRAHRMNFPGEVREAALKRAEGRCEHVDAEGNRCPCRLQKHYYDFAHIVPDRMGGRPTLDNCGVWCRPCHRGEYAADAAKIAQQRRIEKREAGTQTVSRPLTGSSFSRSSRGFGATRDRATGHVLSRPYSIDVKDL